MAVGPNLRHLSGDLVLKHRARELSGPSILNAAYKYNLVHTSGLTGEAGKIRGWESH